ncbi:MAG TPA: M24 family metallopeptidase [Humibacter sp.]|nr:M24 family metallopeptidase [Humibacter sp.]
MTGHSRDDDRVVKRDRVLEILEEAGADAVVLSSHAAVSWYLDGGRPGVSIAAEPVVAVRVSLDGDEVFTTSNEVGRLAAEELPAGLTVHERAWHEPMPAIDGLREAQVDDLLRAARVPLLPAETERFRRLGSDAAVAMTDALSCAEPGWSERRLAAAVAAGIVRAGADPLVVLVAGESRSAYPHPLPTTAPLGRRAMAVACARRDGLIADLTRWVRFGPPTRAERDAERRIRDVEAAAFDATRPGRPLSDVLDAIHVAYPAAGFAADQWTRHHQGGAAGYNGRDPRAVPGAHDTIHLGQAFAWNPWVPGAKVEDTVLLTGDHSAPRIETLTIDPRWPTVEVAGRSRPATLER